MWCIMVFRKVLFMRHITFFLLSLLSAATLQTSATAIEVGTPSKNMVKSAKITNVVTNVTRSERGDIIQLVIGWDDNMPQDTSYNIVITTLHLTGCSEPPCSAYGVLKKSKQIIIPENPMAHVDQNECGFMFGCNYSVKVETSNASVSGYGSVSVPYCVMGLCSCQHAEDLPEVIPSLSIPNNETIIFNWSLKYLKRRDFIKHRKNVTNSKWKMYLVIGEQTNPLLSWGGQLIPIAEYLYPLKHVTERDKNGTMQGTFKIRIPKQLSSKKVLKFRSYIIDDFNCAGPEQFTKITVPDFFGIQGNQESTNFDLVIVLIILSVLSLCLIPLVITYRCWKRSLTTKVRDSVLELEMKYTSQFSRIFEMEDNINYVDKYIEEAQAKGLADFYEIPHTKIHIGPEIGEGAFGRVYKAVAENLRHVRGNAVVAVKQLKNNPTADEVAEFLSEIEMLKTVGTHKNIVSFLGCCTIRPPYLMIMEFVGRGDLLTYLRTVRLEVPNVRLNRKIDSTSSKQAQTNGKVKYIELQASSQSIESSSDIHHQTKLSVAETTYTIIDSEDLNEPFEYLLDHRELYDFALQIANGMRFLEEQKVTHRDLAARNILIDTNKTLKISDFGLSRHGIYTNTKTRKLPLRWLSIEAIRDNIYSSKSDVWAYGVVLWEIGTLGASPYPTISNNELIPYLLSGKRLEKPDICTDQLYSIMLQCWDENVIERPTFVELYEILKPSTAYIDINSLSSDYVLPPIK